jgi:hypothetical protein
MAKCEGEGTLEDGERFVMVRAPHIGYAGRIGDRVLVTDRNELSVYVVFPDGMRECYPPIQFAALFARCTE